MEESTPVFSIRAVNAIKNMARRAGWDELIMTGNESYYIEKLKDEYNAGNLLFRSRGRLIYMGRQIVNCGKQTSAEIRNLVMKDLVIKDPMGHLIRTSALVYLKRYPAHVYVVIQIGAFQASIKIDEITAQEFIKIGVEVIIEK